MRPLAHGSARFLAAAGLALSLLALAVDTAAAATGVRYTARRLETLFKQPVFVTAAPGSNRMFVVERPGRIRVVVRGKRTLKRPFLDMRRDVYIAIPGRESQDMRGLFSIALAPDYARSGLMYVAYSGRDDMMHVDEVRRSATDRDRADPVRRRVLTVGQATPYHHGGQLQFGPDRMLYISTGTANDKWLPQNLGDLHGKLLRIDPRQTGDQPYSVPADNPFVGTEGVRPEIWALGLREPWRFSFDRLRGGLVLGDVGGDTAEEHDYLPPGSPGGANFGFPIYEGDEVLEGGPEPANYVRPAISQRHSRRLCAAMGGIVVRDRALRGLYGRYLYNDLCSPTLRSARVRPGRFRDDRRVALRLPYLVSFGEDGRGRVWGVSFGGGVYRIEAISRR